MQALDYQDLEERGYGCRADRCVFMADCLLGGQPFCYGHALELVEWLCVPREYRRRMEHPFASVFSAGFRIADL